MSEPQRSIDPTPEQLTSVLGAIQAGQPIVMINLLRYRDQAQYAADAEATPCSGREAYQRYAAVALGKVASVGGEVEWMGEVAGSVIAPAGETWDDAVLVRYPNVAAFLRMVQLPDYQAVSFHRSAALLDSRLIATHPRG